MKMHKTLIGLVLFAILFQFTQAQALCGFKNSCNECLATSECCWSNQFSVCMTNTPNNANAFCTATNVGQCSSTSTTAFSTSFTSFSPPNDTPDDDFDEIISARTMKIVTGLVMVVHITIIGFGVYFIWLGEKKMKEIEYYQAIRTDDLGESLPGYLRQKAFNLLSEEDIQSLAWMGTRLPRRLLKRIFCGVFLFFGPVLGLIVNIVTMCYPSIFIFFIGTFMVVFDFTFLFISGLIGRYSPVYALTPSHAIIVEIGPLGTAALKKFPLASPDPKMMNPQFTSGMNDSGTIIFASEWRVEDEHHRGRRREVIKLVKFGFEDIPRFREVSELFQRLQQEARLRTPITVVQQHLVAPSTFELGIETDSVGFHLGIKF